MKLGLDLFITNASCLHDVSQIRKIHVSKLVKYLRVRGREMEKERKRETERRESLVVLK